MLTIVNDASTSTAFFLDGQCLRRELHFRSNYVEKRRRLGKRVYIGEGMFIFETQAPNWGSRKQCSHQQAGANPCDLGQTAAHGYHVPLLDVHEQPNEFKSGASWCFVS